MRYAGQSCFWEKEWRLRNRIKCVQKIKKAGYTKYPAFLQAENAYFAASEAGASEAAASAAGASAAGAWEAAASAAGASAAGASEAGASEAAASEAGTSEAGASAAFSPPQAARAKDNKAAANRDFFILVTFKINLNY